MKLRRTFIIRWILADESPAGQKSNIDVEYVQTGEKLSVSTLEEAQEWMNRIGLNQPNGIKNSRTES